MPAARTPHRPRGTRAVTLVELLVALAIVSIITSFLFTAFATTTRTVEIGEARQSIMQNARVALDMMAREIQSAVIDSRERGLVFVSADGLNSLPHARLEYPYLGGPPTVPTPLNAAAIRGLGNAQHPIGLDLTANGTTYGVYGQVYDLYRSPLGTLTNRIVSLKPNDIHLPPGPPDRLDFVGLASNLGGFSAATNPRLAEIRYMIAADVFLDGADSDFDTIVDAADSTLSSGATWTGTGDVLELNNLRADTLRNVVKLGLYRGLDLTPDDNPFSRNAAPNVVIAALDVNVATGRYPMRDFAELTLAEGGGLLGAFIYDLQFEFYGKIAVRLDDATDGVDNDNDGAIDEADENGAPSQWGIGWGLQDVRGEDCGADGDARTLDAGQADGILDPGEDLGTDGVVNDPGDEGGNLPNNITDNDGDTGEASLFEGDGRLQSRVMGIWDSRSPDPRNPRRAAELNGLDDDCDDGLGNCPSNDDGADPNFECPSNLPVPQGRACDGVDNDHDGFLDAFDEAADPAGQPEAVGVALFDSTDNDADTSRDDRFYENTGRPEGVDEPDEADPTDDSLPLAVRITITVRDPNAVLDPVVLSTTVWLASS